MKSCCKERQLCSIVVFDTNCFTAITPVFQTRQLLPSVTKLEHVHFCEHLALTSCFSSLTNKIGYPFFLLKCNCWKNEQNKWHQERVFFFQMLAVVIYFKINQASVGLVSGSDWTLHDQNIRNRPYQVNFSEK